MDIKKNRLPAAPPHPTFPGLSEAETSDGSADEQAPRRRLRKDKRSPQQIVDAFWAGFSSDMPGKITRVLPNNYHAKSVLQRPDADEGCQNAVESYDEAARICKEKVQKIVKECRRLNSRYRDPHFELGEDFDHIECDDALRGLVFEYGDTKHDPKSVKRVGEIFKGPRFFGPQGPSANDVRQGRAGDCWLMSALSTVSSCRGLIDKICVARDEVFGVYGFVFHRDGAWIPEVVDDKLYLINADFYNRDSKLNDNWLATQDPREAEREYKKRFQSGSKALYFAQCSEPNETWLPLLEKAFAKTLGDYASLQGGFVGEGVEDLTGGITTELHTADILDRDAFWNNELMQVNKQFLFGCAQGRGTTEGRKGVLHRHAYSILDAREIDGKRLLKLRNPWGNTEWQGPWSDGSEQWTPQWMEKLDHRFGDDGVFWISYDDLLQVYQRCDRTRLLDDEWTVSQQWLSLNVPWSISYHDTHFKVTITQPGPVIVVLSQLDGRYFRGFQSRYFFKLHFRLHKEGESDYLVRSPHSYYMRRSVSTEVDLEPGTYIVMVKIVATYTSGRVQTDDLIQSMSSTRPEKLIAVGLRHDLAHAKAQVVEQERQEREFETQRRRAKRRADARIAFEVQQKAIAKAKRLARKRTERTQARHRLRGNGLIDPFAEVVGLVDVPPPVEAMVSLPPIEAAPPEPPLEIVDMMPLAIDEPQENGAVQSAPLLASTHVKETLIGSNDLQAAGVDRLEAAPGISQPLSGLQSSAILAPGSPPRTERTRSIGMQTDVQDSAAHDTRKKKSKKHKKSGGPGGVIECLSDNERSARESLPNTMQRLLKPVLDELLVPLRAMPKIPTPGSPMPDPFPPSPVPADNICPSTLPQDANQNGFDEGDPWDSELDAPLDTDDERIVPVYPPLSEPPLPLEYEPSYRDEPWNAVCVVGLRVYTKVGNEARIEVVRPGLGEVHDDQATTKEKRISEGVLWSTYRYNS